VTRLAVRRPLAVLVLVLASISLAGQPSFADDEGGGGGGGGASNLVQVYNRSDGAWRARGASSVAHDPGPTVANQNMALARASCTDCRTVAVAVQVVLVEGPVDDFRPANAAVAVNEDCLRCQTFAFARQEVLRADRHVDISDSARDQLEDLRGEVRDVAASPESFDQMTVDLDALTDQLVALLQGEVQRAGGDADDDSRREVDRHED
jgi:putative peptide zinc metalloprotease protein